MFILKSVTLRNFRSINDATFTPLTKGVTGLSGSNGVGKSSFLEGMLWALFDVRGDGISTKHLRRMGADKDEESFVAVVFDHEGNEIEVIRELRGKNSRVIVSVFLDGLEQTHTSVKVANEWIRARLRIDPDGFKTAFVVRQKELDSLVRARPAERRATIERLSGIEKLSDALKTAREKENTQKREVAALPGSEEDVTAADENVKSQEDELSLLQDNANLAEDNAVATHAEFLKLQETARILDEANTVQSQLSSIQESLKAAETRLTAEGDVSLTVTEDAVTEARSSLAALEEELQVARAEHTHSTSVKRELGNEKERLDIVIERSGTTVEKGTTHLQDITKAEKELKVLSGTLSGLEAEVSRLASERSRLNSDNANIVNRVTKVETIVKTLDDNAGDAHCPTCKSALSDVLALTEDFQEEIDALLNDKKKNGETLASLAIDEEAAATDLAKAKVILRSLQSTVDQKVSTEERINEEIKNKDDALARCNEITQEKNALDETLAELLSRGKSLAGEVKQAGEEVQALSKSYEGSQRVKGLVSERDALVVRVADSERALEALLTEAKENQPEVPLNDVASRYRAVSEDYERQSALLVGLKSDLRVQEERMSALEREATRERNVYERKRLALKNLSELAAISDTLDEFRKDRIAQIAPELSETATALISSMTSGRFTEVILDEDFTPTVVNDAGEELLVTQLSGGEESIVALALRVSIGDLITGGVAGLLWLDEVLTAQDADRRSTLMSTLSHIAGRQIVLISHTPESTDSVDKIVNLVPTEEGSFLAEE